MINNYQPAKSKGKTIGVVLTHLFDEAKLVTRHYMEHDDASGAGILSYYTDKNSTWLSDDFEALKGGLYYNTTDDIVTVVIDNEAIYLPGEKLANHLVSVEIVEVVEN